MEDLFRHEDNEGVVAAVADEDAVADRILALSLPTVLLNNARQALGGIIRRAGEVVPFASLLFALCRDIYARVNTLKENRELARQVGDRCQQVLRHAPTLRAYFSHPTRKECMKQLEGCIEAALLAQRIVYHVTQQALQEDCDEEQQPRLQRRHQLRLSGYFGTDEDDNDDDDDDDEDEDGDGDGEERESTAAKRDHHQQGQQQRQRRMWWWRVRRLFPSRAAVRRRAGTCKQLLSCRQVAIELRTAKNQLDDKSISLLLESMAAVFAEVTTLRQEQQRPQRLHHHYFVHVAWHQPDEAGAGAEAGPPARRQQQRHLLLLTSGSEDDDVRGREHGGDGVDGEGQGSDAAAATCMFLPPYARSNS
ncbi:hypothetical protein PTSG_10743 [Salpingoeca rosetta]|uniref:Uncharacterized protein n=1 Tax=Salpingoeca rosetta (strain ATCC 50818 / BSB-021) TaxID=946362 RepID=F2UQ91_SALR5|nr:uncharacterized protein PTSG_10743 [Salpingoeca rosetta]EGD79759.1 hypothetical protein PTSG_10743 [Salpingoeca rosetta]|eukprot:XP_004988708.1 hypothetical protein PTSG_10743 [Salpingoeca rosetta]